MLDSYRLEQKPTDSIPESIPSLNSDNIPLLPPARIKQVDSYDIVSSYLSVNKSIKKVDKAVQTKEESGCLKQVTIK